MRFPDIPCAKFDEFQKILSINDLVVEVTLVGCVLCGTNKFDV